MAFGSGFLISALSFELMDVAYKTGLDLRWFPGGATIYTAANIYCRIAVLATARDQGTRQSSASQTMPAPGSQLLLALS
jgi:ZIP family zinc transporter